MKCEFTLIVKDLKYFLYEDKKHTCVIDGYVTCKALDKSPLMAKGEIDLFVHDSGPDSELGTVIMNYRLDLRTRGNKAFYFVGKKYIQKNSALETGWGDTTTCYLTIYKGRDTTGAVVGTGVVKMSPKDLVRSVSAVSIINSSGVFNRLKWKVEFLKLFLGQIWETYAEVSEGKRYLGIFAFLINPHRLQVVYLKIIFVFKFCYIFII